MDGHHRRGLDDMKTNKVYRDALIALDSLGTPTAKGNKWVKIAHATEDSQLKYLATTLGRLYSLWMKGTGWCRATPITIEGYAISTNRDLSPALNDFHNRMRTYVERVLQSEQPEWQIIAIQKGWKPPQ